MESALCKLETLTNDVFFKVAPNSAASPAKARERAVVFVHGFMGDAKGTWLKQGSESFPALLATDSDLADHDFYLFQYVTKTLGPPAIEKIVAQLKVVLARHLAGSRIFFLAHSMGGLVSMRYLLRLLEEGQPHNVGGLLLYGCPMTGVEWVKYARTLGWLAGVKHPLFRMLSAVFTSSKQLDALTTGSEFLERLSNDWAMRVLNGGHHEVATSHRAWVPVRVVSGNDDWVVKESSARAFYSQMDWINVDKDHRSLVKPSDRSEDTYQIARDFFKYCRNLMKPDALARLRGIADGISKLHQTMHISGYKLDVNFDETQFPADHNGGFGLPEFRPFELNCSYKRLVAANFLKLGIAVGPIAAKSLWCNDFAFLHSLGLTSVSDEEGERLKGQLRPILSSGEGGWPCLFDQVSLRASLDGDQWHELLADRIEAVNDGLIRTFSFPDQAGYLIGQEAIINVRFRGLMNPQIKGYTVKFPWLTEGFVVRVAVQGRPAYLISSHAIIGAQIKTMEEPTKIEHSSLDLVLPNSSIRFDWQYAEKKSAAKI